MSLALHPSPDYVSDTIRRTRDFHEPAILDEIRRRVSGGVLIDAGAMIGNHSTFLAQFVPHIAIHAFEPYPANLPLLRRNTARYRSVVVHPVALSDHEGRVPMTAEPDNLGHARVVEEGSVMVEARTLDGYGFRYVTLIKLDVEAHEPQVIAGAAQTIARWRPLILIEDWQRAYAALLPGYRLAAEWETEHQTFLFEPY